MYGHYPNKIEKSGRCGKALCVTLLLLGILSCTQQAYASHRMNAGLIQGPKALLATGGEVRERGPRSAAMGGCATALEGDAAAALMNPAMLYGQASGGLLFWTPTRFGLTELGSAAGVWVQSLSGWNAAVGLQRFGSELYAEHRIHCAAAFPVGGALSAGVRLAALHIGIVHYGSIVVPLVDAGVRCRLSEGFTLAASGYSLNMPSIGDGERLPAGLSAGLAWEDDECTLALDGEKESRQDLNLRLGAEYRFLERFALRCGAATLSRIWTAGFALRHASFRIEYALAVHSELGVTHTVGIGFEP